MSQEELERLKQVPRERKIIVDMDAALEATWDHLMSLAEKEMEDQRRRQGEDQRTRAAEAHLVAEVVAAAEEEMAAREATLGAAIRGDKDKERQKARKLAVGSGSMRLYRAVCALRDHRQQEAV